MAKIDINDLPLSHWHIRIWDNGDVWASVFSPTPCRTVTGKVSDDKLALISGAAEQLPDARHSPQLGQPPTAAVHVTLDSGVWRHLLLSELKPQNAVRKTVEEILDRVIRSTEHMSGVVQLDETI